jgi:3-phytase
MRIPALLFLLLAGRQDVSVTATVETEPVHSKGDAADDPAIWVHPVDPGRSTILGDDKNGGLLVYGLDGKELQWIDRDKDLNNVDLRYGFPLAGRFADGEAHERVDLVVIGNETDESLNVYKVNPRSRLLEPAGSVPKLGVSPYGGCLYRSAKTGAVSFFVTSSEGIVQQWELKDNGKGGVAGTKVRQFDAGTTCEGAVADDLHAKLYVGEENVGIWKYGAEPGDGDARAMVDACGKKGKLTADVEGLAIYSLPDGTGYLLASSQGNDSFTVYRREGDNVYLGRFKIVDGAIDGVSDTDGIEVTSAALGSAFPKGVFVAQDGSNRGGNQNYKLVPWESIAERFTPPLRVDTTWNPRAR